MPPRRPPNPQADLSLPDDFIPRQAVADPIINSAYKEPAFHWFYAPGNATPDKQVGRRKAQYWYKSQRTTEAGTERDLFAEEESDPLHLVNALREDVRRWRESGYRCTNNVTRTLLQHWTRPDVPRPIFFCQLEAVETIIYILEFGLPGQLARTGFRNFHVSPENFAHLFAGEKLDVAGLPEDHPLSAKFNDDLYPRLVDPSPRAGALMLRRLGCKMATGSGKTTVMSMLITWAFCNRGEKPESKEFPNAVLVCAPNLTVKKRLEVLMPEHPDNYYKSFDLVPPAYREHMAKGKVLVTNWHTLAECSIHGEGGHKVVDLGREPDDAFAKNRLGDLAERGQILVLNDEGHHCWRPKGLSPEQKRALQQELTSEELKAREEEEEEARVWLEGLDKMNNSGIAGTDAHGKRLPGILACVDLSATPFYLSNSGYPEGSPFHWLVSDFGLVDAIEAGITKVPRLPVLDDAGGVDAAGRPDPKYFRLWKHIKSQLRPSDKNGKRPKPEAIYRYAEDAMLTLASQWHKAFKKIEDENRDVTPPVMIIVCDTTETSQIFFEKISGQTEREVINPDTGEKELVPAYGTSVAFPELANTDDREVTIRIDSRKLDEVDPEGGDTKDQAALKLREIIHTVGKKGKPGEHIRCVVSVSMLTEGWDANTVTHILGVRAFGTQLLCEQVVGRGLRRRSYNVDPKTGLLPAEYVDVYGIPFSLIPYKGKTDKEAETTDPIYTQIFALNSRQPFEVKFPNVENYAYDLRDSQILCDFDKLQPYDSTDKHVAQEVWVTASRGMKDTVGQSEGVDMEIQDRQAFYGAHREQEVVFMLAKRLMEDLLKGERANQDGKITEDMVNRSRLFPEIVGIVDRYVKEKVKYPEGADARELALEVHAREIVARIRDNILPNVAGDKEGRLLPVLSRFKKHLSTDGVSFNTSRPTVPLSKSHFNRAPILSSYERIAIEEFEDSDLVDYYTPNHRNIGFTIGYTFKGEIKRYEPDFVLRLNNGVNVVLEVKGIGGRHHQPDALPAKNAAAHKWCQAVANMGTLGQWVFDICDGDSPSQMLVSLRALLAKHGGVGQEQLPFKVIEASTANPGVTTVPLRSLRSVAHPPRAKGAGAEEQDLLKDLLDFQQVVWEGHPAFAPGMFVARYIGTDMGEVLPCRRYALFQEVPHDATPNADEFLGQVVLVRDSAIEDPTYRGDWTVRRLSYAGGPAEGSGDSQHRYLLTPENGDEPIVVNVPERGKLRIMAKLITLLPAR
jgi:type III restriction enzyme